MYYAKYRLARNVSISYAVNCFIVVIVVVVVVAANDATSCL